MEFLGGKEEGRRRSHPFFLFLPTAGASQSPSVFCQISFISRQDVGPRPSFQGYPQLRVPTSCHMGDIYLISGGMFSLFCIFPIWKRVWGAHLTLLQPQLFISLRKFLHILPMGLKVFEDEKWFSFYKALCSKQSPIT